MRRMTIGSVVGALVCGAVICACGGAPANSASGAGGATRDESSTAGPGSAVALPAPLVAAVPQTAAMPSTGKSARAHGTYPAGSSSATATHPATGMTTGSGSGTTGASSQPPAPSVATCTKPQYVTSEPLGMWNQAPYFVYNDAWNASAYQVSQTLYACSSSDWYVVATMNNDSGDGAVKTYPNSHRDFDNHPLVTSLNSVTSTFADSAPSAGIYENAYDIWLNNAAENYKTEVMVWTDNHGQSPGGSAAGTATIDGRGYQAWRGTGSGGQYIALVADQNFMSGTVNLLDIFQWIAQKGWLPSDTELQQIDYGAEIVSTGNVPETFSYSNFAVNAS
jgi:Glycosyl hydrolase family 12